MRTIFISIFQGIEAKNILRTDVARTLLSEPDVQLVCFVKSRERADYCQKEFPHERVTYEVFYRAPDGRFERLMSFLKFHLIRTKTTALKRRMHLEETGDHLRYALSVFANWLIARPSVRKLLRSLDHYLISDPGFSPLFLRYRPDVVFLAHLFDDVEVAMLREARRRGVPTVGYINSWDKVTARSSLRLLPDVLLVFNEIVRAEAVKYADMPAGLVIPAGIPQYDQYINDQPSSREAFFKKIGIDPAKKLVVYAPMGKAFSDSDWEVIDFMKQASDERRIEAGAELFVRFQPNDFIDEIELTKRPWLKYDLPGIRFGQKRGVDWDMGFEELKHLTDTLAYLSVIVCYASSIAIDASIFDKPVIGIAFEIKPGQPLKKSPTQYYRTEHYSKAIQSGGIYLARSRTELVEAINRYLAHPAYEREGRKRLVQSQCWKLDGKAGERLALAVLKAMEQKH
ncbi:MAG: CDP-glycerol glycerophosphotransferase family protein [Candidatus Sungbacteria bacterium]|nr:CDP-glycerol glycerophosphotransferase family protein [Candidatus Sungbacteria bacterium]